MIKEVLILSKGQDKEAWGALTKVCQAHLDFSYATLKGKKFPFFYKGWLFEKVPYSKAIK